MAKANKASKATTNEISSILEAMEATLLPITRVRVSQIMTWEQRYPNFEKPVDNVGRDTNHTQDSYRATAVSLIKNGQFVPVVTTPQGDVDHVLVDGDRRLQAARLIVDGFDYQGTTYPAQPDFELDVRPVSRPGGVDLSLPQVTALGRYLNTDRNMTGVTGPLSIGRTAKALRAIHPDITQRGIVEMLLTQAGISTDESVVSRGLKMATLPDGMQEQLLIGETSKDEGIAYSAIFPHLGAKQKQPNAEQWNAFYDRTKYNMVVNAGKKNETTIERHDLRAVVIDAWYNCGFDLDSESSPFTKWKCDGTKAPTVATVKPALSAEEMELAEKKRKYSWTAFRVAAKAIAENPKTDESVGQALTSILDTIDHISFSAAEGIDGAKAAKTISSTLTELLRKGVAK